MRVKLLLFILLIFSLNSCNLINRNRMFQTPADYPYTQVGDQMDVDYKITPNDIITFQLLANNGFQLVNIAGSSGSLGGSGGMTYTVEHDGFIKLPMVQRVYVKGLTIRQLEMMLEDIFAEYYHQPFVILKVTNKRVFIFAGASSKVLQLTNDNTTLFEVLSQIGGLADNAFADRIKIIRGDPKNPEVYKIDLSTIEGMKHSGIVIQGNDIIYIETKKQVITQSLALLAPYFSLISTALLIWGVASGFGK